MIRKYDKNQSKYKNAIWLEGWEHRLKGIKEGEGKFSKTDRKHLKNIFSLMFYESIKDPASLGWDKTDLKWLKSLLEKSFKKKK